MRFGAGIWLFGQFVDRYATDAYGPAGQHARGDRARRRGRRPRGARHQLSVLRPRHHGRGGRAGARRGRHRARGASRRTSTRASSRGGAFTNPDPAVRRRALEICEQGVDAAQRLGAPTVKLWPGQDGFDYPFQADYRELWRLELEGVRTVAEMDAEHPRRDRVQGQGAAHAHQPGRRRRARWSGSQQIGRDDVGIVVDLGHSLFAKEAPADVLSLVHEHGRLFTIEVNDNWREWDDDLAVGSIHLIETLEFFLEVRKIGWDEPILLDQFPFREDPVEAARTSIETIRAIDAALDRLDLDALERGAGAPGRARRAADRASTCCSAASRSAGRAMSARRRSSAGAHPRARRISPRIVGIGLAGRWSSPRWRSTRPTRSPTSETTAGGREAFDPREYGEETYPKAVATLEENAQSRCPSSRAALRKDPDAAGEQYGHRARAAARTPSPVKRRGRRRARPRAA